MSLPTGAGLPFGLSSLKMELELAGITVFKASRPFRQSQVDKSLDVIG